MASQPEDPKAYTEFKEALSDMKKRYKVLYPSTTDPDPTSSLDRTPAAAEGSKVNVVIDPESVKEFFRGGIVRVVALWEGYVKRLLRETFRKKYLENSQITDLKTLKAEWPNCQTAIQNALLERCKKENPTVKDVAARAFEALVEREEWNKLLEEHLDRCLRKLKLPVLGPVVSRANKGNEIDAAFQNLFLPVPRGKTTAISEKIISNQFEVNFRTKQHQGKVLTVKFTEVKQLCNVSRLYYGVRCVLAHGDAQPTFERSLHNFPKKEGELFPSEYKHAEEHLYAVYKRLDEHLDASVDYWTWNNINRFMIAAAEALKKAVYDPFFTDDLGH